MGLHQRQIGLKSVENVDWSGKKVLDIGCSNGKLSLEILEKTNIKELAGIDPAPDRISKAIELAESKNLKNVSFYAASSENLEIFSDDSFDAIFCNMAFQQFKNPQKALNEMFRVLKKGGEAIINFNIEKSPVWVQQEILYNRYYGDPNKEIIKIKSINEKFFYDMAKNAGFSMISVPIKDDIYFYESFEEIIDMMDISFFSKDKKLNEEQEVNLNKELKKYLESTRTSKGIPESWKIIFGKLVK
jgi:ubiquinone/menaquinone biosynthesis C-methylase UbiE